MSVYGITYIMPEAETAHFIFGLPFTSSGDTTGEAMAWRPIMAKSLSDSDYSKAGSHEITTTDYVQEILIQYACHSPRMMDFALKDQIRLC
ncbi:uncharacterized protein MYCFIDRAFT_174985 [Pseudocercospora fijiensis CIRAD86]|uniref:Uncharacterized protein n=1 Tax=Pseudocercospora fijiensis (strain CIRAD86) TaxID=383855 RepID=M3B2G0_PSEFD|nr:uncharacterized protein MYCFIDRAFT_174985 [Pseudocercospora fijiensis CIRAD86]EME83558.1 hypothetical protein MYCFIDRAFT_174985 [Pseudocercospora fijiensis CIRAD86]